MIETKITCDGCGKEIGTTTNYMREWYLELQSVSKSLAGRDAYLTEKGSAIVPKHFHGLNCIGVWYQEKL